MGYHLDFSKQAIDDIDFYKKSDQTNGHITFIKNGVKYIFESENDLKIFLDKQADN